MRNMSSMARAVSEEVVCIWDHGHLRTERVNGFWDAVRHVWKAEGIRGLWKGAGTTLCVSPLYNMFYDVKICPSRVIAVPSSTAYMLTYDHFLNVLLPPVSPFPSFTPLFAGILARTLITSIASPLELVRTNLQSTPLSPSNPHTLRSVLTSIRALVHTQGAFSLWRGLGPTLWRDVPFSGIYWSNYESTKHYLESRGHSGAFVPFLSGAFSGTTAALITSPFDVLKTRRQALLLSLSSDGKPAATSTISVLSGIIRNEGPASLFAGLTPRIAKIAPACGIMIACYEVSNVV